MGVVTRNMARASGRSEEMKDIFLAYGRATAVERSPAGNYHIRFLEGDDVLPIASQGRYFEFDDEESKHTKGTSVGTLGMLSSAASICSTSSSDESSDTATDHDGSVSSAGSTMVSFGETLFIRAHRSIASVHSSETASDDGINAVDRRTLKDRTPTPFWPSHLVFGAHPSVQP
jgi:hypothetical protein